MNKICTSIEQSKKLLSLGLDPSTADMYYHYVLPKSDKLHHVPDVGEPTNALNWYNKGYTLNGKKEPLELKDFCIPSWSLAALLNYLREIDFFPEIDANEITVTMSINYYNEAEAQPLAPIHNIEVKAESFIDACYEMIVKLHELNLL